jgi:hypothetical protein
VSSGTGRDYPSEVTWDAAETQREAYLV